MDMLHLLAWSLMPALVLIGAMYDATSFTIPNWISIGLAVLFAPAALLMGVEPAAVGVAYGCGFVLLLVGMGMFAAGWIGGGDAKLLAAVAIWMGLPSLPIFILVTALAGGVLAVLLAGARTSALQLYAVRAPVWVGRLMTPGGPAPYGIAIAAGALAAFPTSPLVVAAAKFGLGFSA